jgi:hypothetical protein
MEYAVELASCSVIYVPNFMKIGAGVQEILWLCLRNFRGCNVGITYERNLRITILRWGQVQ